MKPLRVGIVGAGFGAVAHLPALRNHPGFEVVAIVSPSRAQAVAAAEGLANAFTSTQEMLTNCALDVVVVASPPFAHREDVLAALAAHKHVLCEKPFALNVADARAMRDASEISGTVCGISHEFRFIPQVMAIKELVGNGHLGAIRDLEGTLLRATLRASESRKRSWWFDRTRGGGVAGALLSHIIDQANWIVAGIPEEVYGTLRTANPLRHDDRGTFESTVDDGAAAIMLYRDATIARLCADGTTAVESYTLAVHGERRTAVASGPTMTELALYAVDADVTDELTCKPSPYSAFASINANVPPLMELYDQLLGAIEGRPNALPTFEEGVVTQEALAAIGYGV